MQRTYLIVIGLLAASVAGQVHAQGVPAAAPASAYTKVGVVNMGVVYTQYKRVDSFKKEMDRQLKPYKDKQMELQKLITEWQTALKNPDPKALTDAQRDMGRRIIVDCTRKLEDLELELKKTVAKNFEDQMVLLNKDINDRIREYAGSHGYHLVLAFGEPEVALQGLTEFRRKMGVIDAGGVTIAYFAPNIDISREVVQSLNSSWPGSAPLPGVGGAPVSRPPGSN